MKVYKVILCYFYEYLFKSVYFFVVSLKIFMFLMVIVLLIYFLGEIKKLRLRL